MTQADLDRLAARAAREIAEGLKEAQEPAADPGAHIRPPLPPQTRHIRPPTKDQTRHLHRRT